MIHTHRLEALAVLGLLAACSSTGSDGATDDNRGGRGGMTSAGSTSTAGQAPTGGTGGSVGGAGAFGGTSGTSGTGGSGGAGGSGTTAGTGGGATSGTGGQAGSGGASTGGVGGTGVSGTPGTGGTSGSGGTPSTGGAGAGGAGSGGGAGTGTGGSAMMGDLRIDDPVPGFASVDGGTTGGGTNLASATTVSTMSALESAAIGSNAAIILVEPGNYNGSLRVGSNKTIVGLAPGVTITGNIEISGGNTSNVIIRNLAVRGNRCNSYDECRAGADAVYMGSGAHHIWLDHLDIADGQDGNCDATQGADYITVSWSHFHYTYAKEHRFSNLIAGSDSEPESVGKLRITYMNSHWGERVDSRQPRGRFGNIHMLNNYHNTGGGQIHGVGVDMALIAENCVYDENLSIFTDMGSPRGWRGTGNEGSASDLNASRGSVFEIPYEYTPMPASAVVDAVTSTACGAGNTCTFAR